MWILWLKRRGGSRVVPKVHFEKMLIFGIKMVIDRLIFNLFHLFFVHISLPCIGSEAESISFV